MSLSNLKKIMKDLQSSSKPAIKTNQKPLSKAEFVKLAKEIKKIFKEEEKDRIDESLSPA